MTPVYHVKEMIQVRGPIVRCRKSDGTPPQKVSVPFGRVVGLTMRRLEAIAGDLA